MVNKSIVNILISFFILITFSSCNNMVYIDDEITQNTTTQSPPYVHSEDIPVEYNAINGVETLQYSDGYIYFHNNYNRDMFNYPQNRSLMKYNVITNNLTSLCQDPLCTHNTENCPFFSMYRTMYVFDNKVVYTQLYSTADSSDDFIMSGKTRLYDVENNRDIIRNTFEVNNYSEYMSILPVDNYILYYDNTYNEDLDEWVDSIYRWNIEDNSTSLMCGESNIYDKKSQYPNNLACQFLFTLDSRVYFTDGATIFSTDINYDNRIDHVTGKFVLDVFTDGEYIFYGVPVSDGSYIQSLHRVDFDGKNDINLNITATKENISITKNFIYYKKYDEIDIGACRVTGYSGDRVILENSEIWRCDHNGQNHELIYKFEGNMANYRIIYDIYVGNYIYGLYDWWEDTDGDGTFEDGDNHFSATKDEYKIMRIDITTGDICIIDGIK